MIHKEELCEGENEFPVGYPSSQRGRKWINVAGRKVMLYDTFTKVLPFELLSNEVKKPVVSSKIKWNKMKVLPLQKVSYFPRLSFWLSIFSVFSASSFVFPFQLFSNKRKYVLYECCWWMKERRVTLYYAATNCAKEKAKFTAQSEQRGLRKEWLNCFLSVSFPKFLERRYIAKA